MNSIAQKRLTDGFETEFFLADIDNLNVENSLRYSNFAYAIRELIRNILERLSPDINVRECGWFELHDPLKPELITRAQRIRYAIHRGLSSEYVQKILVSDINSITSELVNKIGELSNYTHISPETFGAYAQKQCEFIINDELEIICVFLEKIEHYQQTVSHLLINDIQEHLDNAFMHELIDDLDMLSTHYYINEVYIENFSIKNIDSEAIEICGNGSIDVEQTYGSGAEGTTINTSFPFNFNLKIDVYNPNEFNLIEYNVIVDTRDWYE
jgi:hypothetical protein